MTTIPTDFHSETDQVSKRGRRLLSTRRRSVAILLATIGLFTSVGNLEAASATVEDFYQTAGGMAVYIGLLPAEILNGLPAVQPEATMHGRPPSGQHVFHLLVAVFAAPGGQRISDAKVTARIFQFGIWGGNEVLLDPMQIADTITYGAFASFPSTANYVIHVEVARPGADPIPFDFPYDHQP